VKRSTTMTNSQVNKEMIILAREFRGLTQSELSQIANIDQGFLSRIEAGKKIATDWDLDILSKVLRFPKSFFMKGGERASVDATSIYHRKKKNPTAALLKHVYSTLSLHRLSLSTLLQSVDIQQSLIIPDLNIQESGINPEDAANRLRMYWRIPSGPIPNILSLLEASSCFVFSANFASGDFDALVQWTDRGDTINHTPPIILINSAAPGDRLRFSLAHELGHLVLHRGVLPYDEMEAEAHDFASAFLMPKEDFEPELRHISLEHFVRLKPYWKVSIQAMIMRAYKLGVITKRKQQTLFQGLSAYGWRIKEPVEIEKERPILTTDLIEYHRNELGYNNIKELGQLLSLEEEDIKELYLPPTENTLRIVKR